MTRLPMMLNAYLKDRECVAKQITVANKEDGRGIGDGDCVLHFLSGKDSLVLNCITNIQMYS